MSVHEVMREIERDIPFYDQSNGGVTFSGGEPLMQPSFLMELLHACKLNEIHTIVDSSGYASWEKFDEIRQDVDLFLYDLKLMDDQRHTQYTGVSNKRILNNLQNLAQHGESILVRIPLIPGINDDNENLKRSAEFLAELPGIIDIELMGYHNVAAAKYTALDRVYQLNGTQSPTAEHLKKAEDILKTYDLRIKTT